MILMMMIIVVLFVVAVIALNCGNKTDLEHIKLSRRKKWTEKKFVIVFMFIHDINSYIYK